MQPVGFNFYFDKIEGEQLNDSEILIYQIATVVMGCICYYLFTKEPKKKELKESLVEWIHENDQNGREDKVRVALQLLDAAHGGKRVTIHTRPLTNLPPFSPELKGLTSLEICQTLIRRLPKGLEHLKNLEKLFLEKNRIDKLSKRVFQLKKLQVFSLECNSLEELPDRFSSFKDLCIFSAGNNRIRLFPRSLLSLEKLKVLHLFNNKLHFDESDYPGLRQLEALDLSHNNLRSIPKTLFKDSLVILDLSVNQMEALPEEIAHMEQLKVLLLSQNQLKELPVNVKNLQRLVDCDLSFNPLEKIPPQIGELTSLRRLNLMGDLYLSELPFSISRLSNLVSLNLEFTSVPQEQFDLLCARINGTFYVCSESQFKKTFSAWAQIAQKRGISPPQNLTDTEKVMLVNWMLRLEATVDFSRERKKVTALCIDMIRFLENPGFKEPFFLQLQDNLSGCEDRALLNLVLLTLNFVLQEQKEVSQEDRRQLFYRCAKTLEILKMIPEKLLVGESHKEDTEVFLYVLKKFQTSMDLMLPFAIEMHYPEYAARLIKKDVDWASFAQHLESIDPVELIFSHLPEQVESFVRSYYPEKGLQITKMLEKQLEQIEELSQGKDCKTYLEEMDALTSLRKTLYKEGFREAFL